MTYVLVVNKQEKYSLIKKFRYIWDAEKYVRKIYYIPPQDRVVIPCMVRIIIDTSYNALLHNRIIGMLSSMIPDRDTLFEYMSYPIFPDKEEN